MKKQIKLYLLAALGRVRAENALLEMGFTCVRSMAEGFAGWARRGFPTES